MAKESLLGDNSKQLSPRLLDKLSILGQQAGLGNDPNMFIDSIVGQYPVRSIRELAKDTGLARQTLEKIFNSRGISRLSVAESAKINQEQGRGFYGLTKEERLSRYSGQAGGQAAFRNKTGIHAFTAEQKRERSQRGGVRTKELQAGIFAIPEEEKLKIASRNGRQNVELKRGIYGRDPDTRHRHNSYAGHRAHQLKAGIHAQTLEARQQLGIRNSEINTSLKVNFENNYYDSQVEAVTATMLARFIPDFTVTRGQNYQLVIPQASKKVDFVINGVLIEYDPVILRYTSGRKSLGSFDTQAEYDTFKGYLAQLPETAKREYKMQVIEQLRKRYYDRRRAEIDKDPDYRERELIVVENPMQLYAQIITRFGDNYPPQKVFLQIFNHTLLQVKETVRQQKKAEKQN